MTRIKEDIIREVMSNVSVEKTVAKKLIEAILRNLKESLASGDEVLISGFGHFRTYRRFY